MLIVTPGLWLFSLLLSPTTSHIQVYICKFPYPCPPPCLLIFMLCGELNGLAHKPLLHVKLAGVFKSKWPTTEADLATVVTLSHIIGGHFSVLLESASIIALFQPQQARASCFQSLRWLGSINLGLVLSPLWLGWWF